MSSAQMVEGQLPAVQEMVVIHRGFRRSFAAAPGLVRGLRAGDDARIALVVDHLRELMVGVHIHHTGEDEYLWPLLSERATMHAADVELMEQQHHRIEELVGRLGPLLDGLAAGPDVREQVALVLEELGGALDEHMTIEEERILPLVEQHLTVAEWGELGRHGLAQIEKKKLLMTLSGILDVASPEERQLFLSKVPAPVRVLWKVLGRRQYARARARLYATAR